MRVLVPLGVSLWFGSRLRLALRGGGREFGAVAVAGLCEHVLEMRLHGPARHQQAFGDLGVGQSLGDELDDALLRRSQAGPSMARTAPLAAGASGVRGGLVPSEHETLLPGSVRSIAEAVAGGAQSVVIPALLSGPTPLVAGLTAEPFGRSPQPKRLDEAVVRPRRPAAKSSKASTAISRRPCWSAIRSASCQ